MRSFQLILSSRRAWRSVIPDLADSATLLTLEDLNVPREAAAKLVGVVSVCLGFFLIFQWFFAVLAFCILSSCVSLWPPAATFGPWGALHPEVPFHTPSMAPGTSVSS